MAAEGETFVDGTGSTWKLVPVIDLPNIPQDRIFVSPQEMAWIRRVFGSHHSHGEWTSEDEIREHRRDAGRFAARRQAARRGVASGPLSPLLPDLFPGMQ